MATLVLSTKDVKESIDMKRVLKAVENAFLEHGNKKVIMPSKLYIDLPKGDFRAMPSYLEGLSALKWVCVYPKNPKSVNLPSVMGVVILNDPDTGYPLAVMDGTLITQLRTGASAAVASKYLAKKDSKSFGLIGCGAQSYTQFTAIRELFDISVVKIYDTSKKAITSFKSTFSKNGVKIESVTLEKVGKCDIISTVTPVRKPIVKRKMISPGAHINAIGADAKGKEELDPQILLDSKVVVDDLVQASHAGEINVPISSGLFDLKDVYAELGEIVAGKKKGRTKKDEITVFDSTGLAIQDAATAKAVFELAKKNGLGIEVDFVGGDI